MLRSWFVTADELRDPRALPSQSLQMDVGQVRRQLFPSHPNTRNDTEIVMARREVECYGHRIRRDLSNTLPSNNWRNTGGFAFPFDPVGAHVNPAQV
jgi:hypothetical protein